MDHMLYIAASAAKETLRAQAVNTNNLANITTTGFKADLAQAETAYLVGEGQNSRAYGVTRSQGFNFQEGAINTTGRELDVAINGEGWIAVIAPDGGEAYSRRGDLTVNVLGQVKNGAGQQLLGNGGPIALPPFSDVVVGSDGTISIVPLGESPNTLVVVDRIKLVKPPLDTLEKGLDGLMRGETAEPAAANASVRLVSGALEASNVNAVSAMVEMIELARQYETNIKMMTTAADLDRSSAELMRLS